MHNIADTFAARDVYLDYEFEQVMFRWERATNRAYRKFYGKAEDPEPVPGSNWLWCETLLSGDEISPEAYLAGKPRLF